MKKYRFLLLATLPLFAMATETDLAAFENIKPPRAVVLSDPEPNWRTPMVGEVVSDFSPAERKNGIVIQGEAGQAVRAAAAGEVRYIGNGLKGHKNLIIVQHNSDFITAYSNNGSVKVKENDWVQAGETIATVDSSGKLQFEIRRQGQVVDPTVFLPKAKHEK